MCFSFPSFVSITAIKPSFSMSLSKGRCIQCLFCSQRSTLATRTCQGCDECPGLTTFCPSKGLGWNPWNHINHINKFQPLPILHVPTESYINESGQAFWIFLDALSLSLSVKSGLVCRCHAWCSDHDFPRNLVRFVSIRTRLRGPFEILPLRDMPIALLPSHQCMEKEIHSSPGKTIACPDTMWRCLCFLGAKLSQMMHVMSPTPHLKNPQAANTAFKDVELAPAKGNASGPCTLESTWQRSNISIVSMKACIPMKTQEDSALEWLEANANATCWLLTVLRVKRPMTGWEAGKAWDIWQAAWQAAWQAHRRKCLAAAQWCSQEHPDIPPRSASLPASAAQEKARSNAPGLRCRKLLGLHEIGSPKVRFEFLGSSESVNRVQHLCVLRT